MMQRFQVEILPKAVEFLESLEEKALQITLQNQKKGLNIQMF